MWNYIGTVPAVLFGSLLSFLPQGGRIQESVSIEGQRLSLGMTRDDVEARIGA